MASAEDPNDRPRTRGLSFSSKKSDKSWRSKDVKSKIDLTETANEKSKRRITSKADPTKAMMEEEPSVAAAQTSLSVNYESIRLMQHKDVYGNVIADPDRSNPTRNRWERPLDTIRAFEAAIDGPSRRSHTPHRSDSSDAISTLGGRRNSSIPRHGSNPNSARFPQDSSYQGASGARPDSYHGNSTPPNSYFNQSRSKFNQRMPTDPGPYNGQSYGANGQGVYPSSPGYQQSYDTVTTLASGSGSHGADQWGNSTDPSSENSSLDRNPHIMKPLPSDAYGHSGYGSGQQTDAYGYSSYGNGQQQFGNAELGQNGGPYTQQQGHGGPRPPYGNGNALPTPPKAGPPVSRVPIKLGTSGGPVQPVDDSNEKRKSWFRRFSRNG